MRTTPPIGHRWRNLTTVGWDDHAEPSQPSKIAMFEYSRARGANGEQDLFETHEMLDRSGYTPSGIAAV